MDAKVRAKLTQELPRVHARLLAYAHLIVRRSGWREKQFVVQRATVADDLLNEAVMLVWAGNREWPVEEVDLFGCLSKVMKSIVSNRTNSPANRTSSLDEPLNDEGDTKEDGLQDPGDCADDLLISARQAARLETRILETAGNDPLLLKYVEVLMDDLEAKPAEIAAKMKVPVKEVYEAHRKLRRQIKPETEEESPHDNLH